MSRHRNIYQDEVWHPSKDFVDRELSSKHLSRRWDFIRHIFKTRKCRWKIFPKEDLLLKVHQDKKFSSKKFWRRISFLVIIFKMNNFNRKYSTRRGDNQILLKTRKYWRYIQWSLVRRKSVVISLNFTSQCCLHCECIFVNIFERFGRFKFVHMKKKEKLSHIRNVKVKRDFHHIKWRRKIMFFVGNYCCI